jgi:large subunit ribosomal protein L29
MTKNKMKELRELTNEELLKMVSDINSSLRTKRFQAKIERPSNPMEKHELRKKVAVIYTILRERELKELKKS